MVLGCGTYLMTVLDIQMRVFVKLWIRLSALVTCHSFQYLF